VYHTGSKDDWDRYAKIAGDARWSWEAIQPILRKVQNFKTPADNSDSVRGLLFAFCLSVS
jgi:hypothetical protein